MPKNRRDPKAVQIGHRIAEARLEAGGMSQRELADLVGVSERSVQAYEQGEVIPWRYMGALEKILGKPTAFILHGESGITSRDEQLTEIRDALGRIEGALADLKTSVIATCDGHAQTLESKLVPIVNQLGR